jgi:transposase
MLSLPVSTRYFLHRYDTDMRKGFDGLSGLVRNVLLGDPLGGDVFIFFNKRHNQVKLLLWEGDGFSIYHKRLEKGTYEVPLFNDNSSSITLKSDALSFILQGVSLNSIRRRKRFDTSQNTFHLSVSS